MRTRPAACSSFPAEFTLDNFVYVLTEGGFATFLRNSLVVALVVVVASGLLGLLASIAVARFRFRLRTQIVMMILIVQMVPLEALVIPLFVQVRDLQLLGTLLGLVVVYTALALPFGIWMLRGFVAAVPVELEEAAYIDGASWWRMFRSVLLPLVAPGLVATSVFAFITAWNEFIFAMTLLGGETENYTVSIGLRQFFGGPLERLGLGDGRLDAHHDPRHDLLHHRAAAPLQRSGVGGGEGLTWMSRSSCRASSCPDSPARRSPSGCAPNSGAGSQECACSPATSIGATRTASERCPTPSAGFARTRSLRPTRRAGS